jgi:hypothetical protein
MALKPKVGGAAAKTIGFSLAPQALKNMAKLEMYFGTHGGTLTAFDNSEIDFTGSYRAFGQPAPSASASSSLTASPLPPLEHAKSR